MTIKSNFIRQRDELDCGPACLASVAKAHGLEHSVAKIRELSGTDQDGTTLLGLAEAAEKLGFEATGCRADSEALAEVPLPAIAHWKGNHFVVIVSLDGDTVVFGDPAEGVKRLSVVEFGSQWTGYLLLLQPKVDARTSSARQGGRLIRFAALLVAGGQEARESGGLGG